MDKRQRTRKRLWQCVVVSLGVGLMAGSASAASASATSTSAKELNKAKAVVAQLLKAPVEPTFPALPKAPAKGKVLGDVACSLPACEISLEDARAADQLLGWKTLPLFNAGSTPTTYAGALQQAIQAKPNYLYLTALQPDATIKKQLQQAQQAHLPIYEVGGSSAPTGPIFASYFGPKAFAASGFDLAAWVTAASNGKGQVANFTDPTQPSFLITDKAFESAMKRDCPGCTDDSVTFSQSTIGQAFPSQVVSYVQSHPDVHYLVVAITDAWLGVPQALRAAGLAGRVSLVGAFSSPSDYAFVKANNPSYTALALDQAGGYYFVNAAVRRSEGLSVPKQQAVQAQFLTPKTVGPWLKSKKQWALPDLPQALAKSWHVTIPKGWVPGP